MVHICNHDTFGGERQGRPGAVMHMCNTDTHVGERETGQARCSGDICNFETPVGEKEMGKARYSSADL